MKVNNLPRQIVVLVAAVLVAVLLMLWVSLFSVKNAMDRDAIEDSRQRMAGRIASMQEQVSLIASDYHNWTDLYLNAESLNVTRLASNYGITASRGDIFQYAELLDGPFTRPLSWSVGRGLSPQSSFLKPYTKEVLQKAVPALNTTERQTFDFFEIRDGHLVMFSASYLLPEDEELLAQVSTDTAAIAIIGKILKENRLAGVAEEFNISELEIIDEPLLGTDATAPLIGVSGEPIAWLKWLPPQPGTLLFWKMFPIMGCISLFSVLVFYSAAWLLRSKAEALINQEAVSFHNARTDALTGLPNRLALREHLSRLSKQKGVGWAIVVIDLVRFKHINDTVGHLGGDNYLSQFSQRLLKLSDKTTFVSRIGGDEFSIVISAEKDLKGIIAIKCQQLNDMFTDPIRCNGMAFEALASKGLAIQDGSTFDCDEILRRADRAMYSAKTLHTQKVVSYDAEMQLEDRDEKQIEIELRRSLANGVDFQMHYQPIIAMREGSQVISHYEALARWKSPHLGQVSPEKFIRTAESTGLISPLGWHLIDLVCGDMHALGSAQVAINISPTQIALPGFAKAFADRIKSHGISLDRIMVEITEQIVVRDEASISQELFELAEYGFTLALDDFGTGFSSIGYLTRMPFTVLKIDRSFVSALDHTERSSLMIKSIISLAHAMHLKVVVEGIEAPEQVDLLCSFGVDCFQGYYFSRPSPVGAVLNRPSPVGAALNSKVAFRLENDSITQNSPEVHCASTAA